VGTDQGPPGAEGHPASAPRRALSDLVRDPIVSTDVEHLIVLWNRAAEETYGFERAEALGRRVDALLRSTYSTPRAEIEATIERHGMWEGRVVHRAKDDRALTVESRWVVRLDDAGQRTGTIAIDRDITNDLADAEVRRDEGLDRDRLQSQIDRSEHLDSVGQLASGVAHDFNNSLGVVITYAGIVARELRDLDVDPADGRRRASMQQDVRKIEVAALRAARLIHQLLAFARREIAEPTALDLNDVVTNSAELLRSTVGERVNLELSLAPGLQAIYGDPVQLEQVLVNAASNGRDAMPTGGTLMIVTSLREVDAELAFSRPDLRSGRYVELRVADTGQGMAPDVLARAFEPFFTTKTAGRGSGLGLASTKVIVGRLGGYVELASEVGEGTTLRAGFPVADSGT
jgi:two-component system, cell cycle sensor histidine kinase and response regulator CckA